jgi:hypothetical protein
LEKWFELDPKIFHRKGREGSQGSRQGWAVCRPTRKNDATDMFAWMAFPSRTFAPFAVNAFDC